MHRVNILQRVKAEKGWRNVGLKRDRRGRIQWPSGGRFLIEWRKNGTRLREAAGDTPADALEAQRRKRLDLEAQKSGVKILDESESKFPLNHTIAKFITDIKTFRKKLTWQKYQRDRWLTAGELRAETRVSGTRDVLYRLRRLGVSIDTLSVAAVDVGGRPCRRTLYRLSSNSSSWRT